jgi:hypothetical protein
MECRVDILKLKFKRRRKYLGQEEADDSKNLTIGFDKLAFEIGGSLNNGSSD